MKALLLHAAIGIGTLCAASFGGCVTIATTNPAPVYTAQPPATVQASNAGGAAGPCTCQQAGYVYAPQPYPVAYPYPYAGTYPPGYPQGYPAQYPQGYPAQYPQGTPQQYPQGYPPQYPQGYPQYPQGYPAQYPQGSYPYYPPYYGGMGGSSQAPVGQAPGGNQAGGAVGQGGLSSGHTSTGEWESTPRGRVEQQPSERVVRDDRPVAQPNDGRTPPIVATPSGIRDDRPVAQPNDGRTPPIVATPTGRGPVVPAPSADDHVTTPGTIPVVEPAATPAAHTRPTRVDLPAGTTGRQNRVPARGADAAPTPPVADPPVKSRTRRVDVPPPAPVASATKVSVEADLPAGLEPGSGTETSDVDKPKKDSGHVDVSDESHRKVIEANDGEIITVPRRNTEISPKNAGSAQPD